MAQLIDLLVDGAVFFNIGIRLRNVRFRLVIIVVGNEVFHGVIREKLAELAAKLRGKRFVVCQNKRGTIQFRNDVRHGKRFAAARNAEQRLLLMPRADGLHKFFDCLRLVARRLIF